MKKSNLIILLSLCPLLFSCNDNSSITTDDSHDSISEEVSVSPSWDSSILEVYQNNLYGYIPPYIDLEGLTASYDEELETIFLTGGKSSSEILENYANLLVEDGFFLIQSENNIYMLEKEVPYNDQNYYILTELASLTDEGGVDYDGNGTFVFCMYDPFVYSWPSEDINALITSIGSDAVIPEYEASHYETTTYIDVDTILVYGYDNNPTASTDYKNELIKLGYTVTGPDEDGYYVAISEDKAIEIDFVYFEEFQEFDVIISSSPYWSETIINGLINYLTSNSGTTLPEFKDAGSIYIEDSYIDLLASFIIYTSCDNLASLIIYVNDLEAAGYKVTGPDEDGEYEAYAPNGDIKLYLYIDEIYETVSIQVTYEVIESAWPSSGITKMLDDMGAANDTFIPEFSGEYTGCQISCIPAFGINGFLIYVENGSEESAIETYINDLINAGYTYAGDYYGDPLYMSPNGDIYVCPYNFESGIVTVDVFLVSTF